MAVSPDPKLHAPASRVLLVLGQTPFPVELLDSRCRVLYCNRAYAATFLDKPSEVLDRPSRVFPEQLADGRTRAQVLAYARSRGLLKEEVRVHTADKRELPVRMCIFPIDEPGGGPEEYAVFYEDITVEVEARQSLIHQQNLVAIRSRQAQMGELLSMIAHQWRQPLTVVMSLIGNIQLKSQLGSPVDPDYLAAKLERMAQTVQFLSETIDSFRAFHAPSKLKTTEDLVALTRRALDLVLPSLKKVGTRFEFVAPAGTLPVQVFGGEYQQLVLELVNNARDSLVTAAVVNPLVRVEVSGHEGHVCLKVGNNGPGVPAEILPQIFEPYYTTKELTAGSGLGLYMAKIIVEAHHGGRLTVDTGDGWTCFTSTFPKEAGQP